MNTKYFLLLAIIPTALIAGLFFGFAVAINPAFKQLPDKQYITAMQAINVAIVNPLFVAAFMGPAFLIPLTAWKCESFLIWMAAAVYLIGGIGITFVVNIPLNNMLAAFPVSTSTDVAAADLRRAFAIPWNTWHLIRTLAVILSLVLLVIACLKSSDRIV